MIDSIPVDMSMSWKVYLTYVNIGSPYVYWQKLDFIFELNMLTSNRLKHKRK